MADIMLAVALVWLAVAQVVALGAVLTRHAIPRAPTVFGAALLLPMVVAATTALLMAYMAGPGSAPDMLFGVPLTVYRIAFFASEAMWISVLCIYAYAWHVSIRHRHGA